MKKLKLIGVIVVLIGIIGIISSQAFKFTRREIVSKSPLNGVSGAGRTVDDLQTKNIVLFCGIALCVAGSGCIALSTSDILDV